MSHTYATDLCRAVKRLAASDTPIKRRNARKALRGLLHRIGRELLAAYPSLGKDGKARAARKRPCCPVCGVPMRNWVDIAGHCLTRHNMPWRCWCGKASNALDLPARIDVLARHLAGHGDKLKEIIVRATLQGQAEKS